MLMISAFCYFTCLLTFLRRQGEVAVFGCLWLFRSYDLRNITETVLAIDVKLSACDRAINITHLRRGVGRGFLDHLLRIGV